MTHKEIKKEIKETKREMKENGIRKISIFNGGLNSTEYSYNSKLYKLESMLLKPAVK